MEEARETLFKGMTRPAMIMGVPITPFAIVVGFIFLLAVYTNIFMLFMAVPVVLIMRLMTQKDDFIFRLIGLNLLFNHFNFSLKKILSSISKKHWDGALTFTAQKYRELKLQGQPKITAFDLKQQPCFLDLIPYSSHFSEDCVVDKDGNFIAVWKIEGVAFETTDESETASLSGNLNMIFKSFSSEPVAFYYHNVRHKTSVEMKSVFTSAFAEEIDNLYYQSFKKENLKVNTLFFTFVYQPFAAKLKKSAYKKMSFVEKQNELISQYRQFKEYCARLESNLQKFKPLRLKIYKEDGKKYSGILSFFSYLLSGELKKVRVLPKQINEYMTASLNEIIFGKDIMQLNMNDGGKKFARIIEIKDYTNETYAGILDTLMYDNLEYIVAQSFVLIPQFEAKAAISKQEKQLVASNDDGIRQLNELMWAKDAIVSGDICFGKFHLTITIFGSTKEEAQKNTNLVITSMSDVGFGVTLSNLSLPASYFAQLPCNFNYRPRVNLLSSQNFASFVAFHNFPTGKKEQNCWGDAITALKSNNGTPYYLNFHETRIGKNDFNEKFLGNTLIVGASGSGKTVLQLFLALQMTKYADQNSFNEKSDVKNFSMVFLDKDRGAHAAILAAGGEYFAIKKGVPTGFNPFICENTPEKRAFLYSLMSLLIGRTLSPAEEDHLHRAIESVLNMPIEIRKNSISRLVEHLGIDESREDTIHRRLKNWTKSGAYGWVFDNDSDLLRFPEHKNIYGIDGTEFLDEPAVSAPISLYLFEKINTDLIDGRRFVLNIDECWKWIENPTVAEVVRDKLKTIRKLNGIIVMATQSPEDFLKNPISASIVQQSSTLIFLPNAKAGEDEYIKGFKLTKDEFFMFKNLENVSRTFLLKKGDETTMARLDLIALGVENLKILSTTKDNWDLIDELADKNLSANEFTQEFKKRCV